MIIAIAQAIVEKKIAQERLNAAYQHLIEVCTPRVGLTQAACDDEKAHAETDSENDEAMNIGMFLFIYDISKKSHQGT